jgi:hypothetical protein
MPKDTVGVIAVKNTPELLADWDKSSYAKFMQDDEAKRWMAPMRKEGEAPWDKFFKEHYGSGMYDTLKDYPGALVSFLVISDALRTSKKTRPMSRSARSRARRRRSRRTSSPRSSRKKKE